MLPLPCHSSLLTRSFWRSSCSHFCCHEATLMIKYNDLFHHRGPWKTLINNQLKHLEIEKGGGVGWWIYRIRADMGLHGSNFNQTKLGQYSKNGNEHACFWKGEGIFFLRGCQCGRYNHALEWKWSATRRHPSSRLFTIQLGQIAEGLFLCRRELQQFSFACKRWDNLWRCR